MALGGGSELDFYVGKGAECFNNIEAKADIFSEVERKTVTVN